MSLCAGKKSHAVVCKEVLCKEILLVGYRYISKQWILKTFVVLRRRRVEHSTFLLEPAVYHQGMKSGHLVCVALILIH